MKSLLILLPMIIVAGIIAGCIAEPPAFNGTTASPTVTTFPTPAVTPPPTAGAPELSVQASPVRYTPAMSSTVGIGLYPDYTGPAPVNYSWEANYGIFLGWDQATGKITEYGSTAVSNGQVYWSFPPEDPNPEKPAVVIHAEAVNITTGRPLASATVYIGWEDNTTAVVIPAPCGVTNCHGANLTCGEDIAEICTMEYQLGDKCRSLAACRVMNGTCTVVEQPGYGACKACAENCSRTYAADPVKAFECESGC